MPSSFCSICVSASKHCIHLLEAALYVTELAASLLESALTFFVLFSEIRECNVCILILCTDIANLLIFVLPRLGALYLCEAILYPTSLFLVQGSTASLLRSSSA